MGNKYNLNSYLSITTLKNSSYGIFDAVLEEMEAACLHKQGDKFIYNRVGVSFWSTIYVYYLNLLEHV